MPKIIINEYDETKAATVANGDFAVVVPGFRSIKDTTIFDENGIAQFTSTKEFESNIGFVAARLGEDTAIYHYGNQMAYELLRLGYTVLYLDLGYSVGLTDDELASALSVLGTDDFWAALKDKSVYNFRYVVTGLLNGNTADSASLIINAANAITRLVTVSNLSTSTALETVELLGRGDAIALIDLDSTLYAGKTQVAAISAIKTAINDGTVDKTSGAKTYTLTGGKFATFLAPYVTYSADDIIAVTDDAYGSNRLFPNSFHYLACAAKAFTNFKPWFAVAGDDRGYCDYTVKSVGCKFGDLALNILEPRLLLTGGCERAVTLTTYKNGDYYIWGNRTATTLQNSNLDMVASDFLNIRQLCCTLKKDIYTACKKYSFDPNSDVLWINFTNELRKTLDVMKQNQGINDYKIVKVKSSKKALLSAQVKIVPYEAVEDFKIDVYLENSLVDLSINEEEQ